MSITAKIKNHPGFMPFGHANVSGVKENTQTSEDRAREKEYKENDSKVK